MNRRSSCPSSRDAERVDEDRPRATRDVERRLPIAERAASEILVRRLADVADEVDKVAVARRAGRPESVHPARPFRNRRSTRVSIPGASSSASGSAGGGSTSSSRLQTATAARVEVLPPDLDRDARDCRALRVPAVLNGLSDEDLERLDVGPTELIDDPSAASPPVALYGSE